MEESRQAKEAGFWGRQPAIKRDVPAYWSLATYGQPYHDARLALGTATNVFQVGWGRPHSTLVGAFGNGPSMQITGL